MFILSASTTTAHEAFTRYANAWNMLFVKLTQVQLFIEINEKTLYAKSNGDTDSGTEASLRSQAPLKQVRAETSIVKQL